MHSSPLSLSIALALGFLVARVTPIPAGFSQLEQDVDGGNLFSSSSDFLLDDSPSMFSATGIGIAMDEQSVGLLAVAPADDLLLQSATGDIPGTGTGLDTGTGTDLFWDTNTGLDTHLLWDTGTDTGTGSGGEDHLTSNTNLLDNNNFDLLASGEQYFSPEIGPGDFDDSRFDPTAKCSMKYSHAVCCGYPISENRYIPDCLPGTSPTLLSFISRFPLFTSLASSPPLPTSPSPSEVTHILSLLRIAKFCALLLKQKEPKTKIQPSQEYSARGAGDTFTVVKNTP